MFKNGIFHLVVLTLSLLISSVKSHPNQFFNEDSNPYRHTRVLDKDGKYVFEWLVDWEDERVFFNVTVETRGYVGFGLSKKGKMVGADIVIGGVDPKGNAYFSDRYGSGNLLPKVDESQDWVLLGAWEDNSHTFLSFVRPFETCDDEDITIVDDVLSIIWSYGEKDDTLEYHYQNRGDFPVYLLNADLTPRQVEVDSYKNVTRPTPIDSVGDWKTWRIPITQELPAEDTQYLCTFHKAPRHKSKQHIVGFRSGLQSELEHRHIHHFLLHTCYPPAGVDPNVLFGRHVGRPAQECYVLTRPSSIPAEYCREVRHEWAVGAGPIFFPDHVGIPFSEFQDEYYMLQIHYDNPFSLPNLRLQFFLEVFYTSKLRQYDAGLFYVGVGTPGSPSIMIPPSSIDHVQYGMCAAGCTKKMFPKNGINVFAGKVHTHIAGTGARFMYIQNSKEVPILIDDNYNFNFQQVRTLREEQNILPGDMIVKRCLYDTTDRVNASTVGGFSTRNEMCNGFLWYYPYIREDIYGVCSSEIRSEVYRNFLQIYNFTWSDERRENIVTSPQQNAGLAISEVGSRIDWTLDKRKKLQTHQRYIPQVTGCPSLAPYAVDKAKRRREEDRRNEWLSNSKPVLRRYSSYREQTKARRFLEKEDFTELNREIVDPENEFVSLWPKNIVHFKRGSNCPKK